MSVRLGVTWGEAAAVVLSTVAIYLTLILLVRLVGQRSLARMSSFDLAATVAFGAVIGRTMLLLRPTLLAGVIGLTTLFVTQGVLGLLRRNQAVDRLINRTPVLLMSGPTPLADNMRSSHVTEDELRQKLRVAGVRSLDEVACVVLERNGEVSVIRQGRPLSAELFADVPGAHLPGAGVAGRIRD